MCVCVGGCGGVVESIKKKSYRKCYLEKIKVLPKLRLFRELPGRGYSMEAANSVGGFEASSNPGEKMTDNELVRGR